MLYVITGPPCVGKSTWVRERARPGDIVVDLDRIALAITAEATAHHEYPPHIRMLAIRMRQTLISYALRASRKFDVYVIHAKPNERARRIYAKNGARLVELQAPLPVLLERAANERPTWVAAMIRSWDSEPEGDE